MKRLLILTIFLSGCAVLSPLQRSKLLTVSNLIDSGKFVEAKEVVEELVSDNESNKWARTWYLKGHLCQTAYQEGVKRNDKSLQELYPEQLYVAYTSYARALTLDKGGRLERQIAPKYVLLANELQKIGEAHYRARRYSEALKAFEFAHKISQSRILSIEPDMNLVYNIALSAYESKEWDKAKQHLEQLHRGNYSSNASHLLSNAHLEMGDTLAAQRVLREGITKYQNNIDLVLLLTDLYHKRHETDEAIKMLDEVIAKNPSDYFYVYTKGLVYQKANKYNEAIEAYKRANAIAPNELMVYVNIATSYYNIGVSIEENTRTITNSRLVQEEKARSQEAFNSAISWLDQAYERGIDDVTILTKVYDLYRLLRVTDKVRSIENRLR